MWCVFVLIGVYLISCGAFTPSRWTRPSVGVHVTTDRPETTVAPFEKYDMFPLHETSDEQFAHDVVHQGVASAVLFTVDSYGGLCMSARAVCEEIARETNFKVSVIDADFNGIAVDKYKIRSVPTLLLFNNRGEVVGQTIGALSKERLTRAIARLES